LLGPVVNAVTAGLYAGGVGVYHYE
jgi:hypothetical protein